MMHMQGRKKKDKGFKITYTGVVPGFTPPTYRSVGAVELGFVRVGGLGFVRAAGLGFVRGEGLGL